MQAESRLKDFGLTGTQYNALRILRGAGPEGLPCREIGERMITHDSDITRLLNRLQDRGLVERTRAKQDRRVIYGKITAAGLKLLREMDAPIEKTRPRNVAPRRAGEIEAVDRVAGTDAKRKNFLALNVEQKLQATSFFLRFSCREPCSETPAQNLIDIRELPLQIKSPLNFRSMVPVR